MNSCPERSELLAAYAEALSAYASAITQLETCSDGPKRERLYTVSEIAKLACERARTAIAQHQAAHRC